MIARSTPQSWLFVAAIFAPFFSSLAEATCWCRQDGNIIDCSTTETACPNSSSVDGGAQLCCVSGDICGEDSLCHFNKLIANTSGYYLGGCTDQSYNDPVCQGVCKDGPTTDVVYNAKSDSWSCCAYPNNTVSCENPRTDESFKAISPAQFPFAASSSTRASSSTTASTSSTTTSSATAAAAATSAGSLDTSSQSSSGLSTGAAAGIAVACVIAGLALIGLAVFFVLRRRRRSNAGNNMAPRPYFSQAEGHDGALSGAEGKGHYAPVSPGYGEGNPVASPRMYEVDGVSVPQQLYGSESGRVIELP